MSFEQTFTPPGFPPNWRYWMRVIPPLYEEVNNALLEDMLKIKALFQNVKIQHYASETNVHNQKVIHIFYTRTPGDPAPLLSINVKIPRHWQNMTYWALVAQTKDAFYRLYPNNVLINHWLIPKTGDEPFAQQIFTKVGFEYV